MVSMNYERSTARQRKDKKILKYLYELQPGTLNGKPIKGMPAVSGKVREFKEVEHNNSRRRRREAYSS